MMGIRRETFNRLIRRAERIVRQLHTLCQTVQGDARLLEEHLQK